MSEFELIDRIASGVGRPDRVLVGIGDDCAVVKGRGRVVTSVDTAVAGVHFQPGRPAVESAWKAVASAVSDLAAMGLGGPEIDILVALGAPPETSDAYLEGIVEGVKQAAETFGAELVGGDVVAAPAVFLSVTAMAHSDPETRLVTRSGAEPGDLVAITGPVGGAAAGLELIEGAEVGELSQLNRDLLIECQVRPRPELSAAPVLAGAGATAMIDVSDGLIADLGHIAEASGVNLRLDPESIPVVAGAGEVFLATGRDPLQAAISGGEDYVLALTMPETKFAEADSALIEATGFELLVIGAVEDKVQQSGGSVFLKEGSATDTTEAGHDHFRR